MIAVVFSKYPKPKRMIDVMNHMINTGYEILQDTRNRISFSRPNEAHMELKGKSLRKFEKEVVLLTETLNKNFSENHFESYVAVPVSRL